MNQDLLEKFQIAYQDLDLFPLIEPKMIEKFRVEYGREVLVWLKREVEAGTKDSKVVCSSCTL